MKEREKGKEEQKMKGKRRNYSLKVKGFLVSIN